MSEEARTCSIPGCDRPARAGQRYCAECHAKYMKAWRAKRKKQQDQLVEEVLRLRQQNRELREQLRSVTTA